MFLSIQQARELAEAGMRGCGHSAEEARVIADHLIDCELRGLSYGGLPRALSIIERIAASPTPPRPIRIERESAVSAAIDGGDQVGYLVAQRATDLAIAKARDSGVAVVGARQTWYTGMFSYYLEQVTGAGFAGMIAGSGGHIVAPHGGTEKRFGTNPIAFGFPTPTAPMIWDIGTSSVMLAEVLLKLRLGEQLAPGLAFDGQGQPTREPAEALAGAFSVWGGHKGSGLALVVQLLGMLCGAAAAPEGLRDCGFFLLVVDPGLFGEREVFRQRVGEYLESLRATRPLEEGRPVRVPFERSAAERERRLAEGRVEVEEVVYQALVKVAGTGG